MAGTGRPPEPVLCVDAVAGPVTARPWPVGEVWCGGRPVFPPPAGTGAHAAHPAGRSGRRAVHRLGGVQRRTRARAPRRESHPDRADPSGAGGHPARAHRQVRRRRGRPAVPDPYRNLARSLCLRQSPMFPPCRQSETRSATLSSGPGPRHEALDRRSPPTLCDDHQQSGDSRGGAPLRENVVIRGLAVVRARHCVRPS